MSNNRGGTCLSSHHQGNVVKVVEDGVYIQYIDNRRDPITDLNNRCAIFVKRENFHSDYKPRRGDVVNVYNNLVGEIDDNGEYLVVDRGTCGVTTLSKIVDCAAPFQFVPDNYWLKMGDRVNLQYVNMANYARNRA